MKPVLPFLLFACLLSTQLSAQMSAYSLPKTAFSKGNWQMGVRDGYHGGTLIGHRNTLQFQVSHYLFNQLAVGVSGTWAREGISSAAFHDLTIGPYARYQFTTTRLSPFVDFSYQFGKRTAQEGRVFTYTSQAMRSVQISPGVSVGVTPVLRAEISYHFQWIYVPTWAEYIGQPQVGITYLLGRN